MNELLIPALRQFRHNDSDDFVFALDIEEVEAIIGRLQSDLKMATHIVDSAAHVGVDFGYGKFELAPKDIELARELSTKLREIQL